MPTWLDVLKELKIDEIDNQEGPLDRVRRKYLRQLHEKTGRNIIAYYSGWLQNPNSAACAISDADKNGLMTTVHGMDRNKGLDLFLHTPGGEIAATESLVDYLHQMFGKDIRCFIPQLAMSGGTMIACACKEIIMGKQSNIGPIDPQIDGIPVHGVITEFKDAIKCVKRHPSSLPIWQIIIGKYYPAFLGECSKVAELSSEIVVKWLTEIMFFDDEQAENKAKQVATNLNNHTDTKIHARHIHAEEAKSFGLKITMMEEDPELQDLVLTIHHAYMHTFSNVPATKIIENHLGSAVVLFSQPIKNS